MRLVDSLHKNQRDVANFCNARLKFGRPDLTALNFFDATEKQGILVPRKREDSLHPQSNVYFNATFHSAASSKATVGRV